MMPGTQHRAINASDPSDDLYLSASSRVSHLDHVAASLGVLRDADPVGAVLETQRGLAVSLADVDLDQAGRGLRWTAAVPRHHLAGWGRTGQGRAGQGRAGEVTTEKL